MKRTPMIAGNWKMNLTIAAGVELVKTIHYTHRHPGEVDVVVAPPFTALRAIADTLNDSYISVAAQNIHWETSGAFTGEISAVFAKDAGAEYVIIGHSERRQYFGETNETVNKKVKAAFLHGLTPIVCVGETDAEREAGRVHEVINTQVEQGLAGLTKGQFENLIVAYEPVWAIGTGKTATGQQAEEVHASIRELLVKLTGQEAAEKIRILYGGSVGAKNAKELLSFPNIDGALVGGASLKPQDFVEIIKSAGAL
ncbi:MAG: triose-phosphate isomerase [Bdellovibrionales bacterium GWA2_49_15]|nr:MAG: triose-phosphate isomerase [Bdellovibrionales bacterium GWA2_49_15]